MTPLEPPELEARVSRREFLSKNARACRQCHDTQVQLIDPSEIPAVWKCRRCKNVFTYEPGAPDS
jgi:ribosomal protein L37AE/L43A